MEDCIQVTTSIYFLGKYITSMRLFGKVHY